MSRCHTRLSCAATAHLPPWRTCPPAAEPQDRTCSLSSTPWPGTLSALLFLPRLLQGQTKILRTRKTVWFCSTISPCPEGIQKKYYGLLFLICKAPSPLPSWVKHSSSAPPPTNMILPVTIQAKTVTASEFLLFSLSLRPAFLPSSKEALKYNGCRDRKGKKAYWADLYPSPARQGYPKTFSVSSSFK